MTEGQGLSEAWKTTALMNADFADRANARVAELEQELAQYEERTDGRHAFVLKNRWARFLWWLLKRTT